MIHDSNIPEAVAVTLDPNSDMASSLEWLHQHTNFPTFEQFKLNPDRYREKPDEIFESIDSLNLEWKDKVAQVKYFWRGEYEATLHKIYDIARNEGFKGSDLEMEPIAESMDGTSNQHDNRVKITVNVWPKSEFKAKGGIVANA